MTVMAAPDRVATTSASAPHNSAIPAAMLIADSKNLREVSLISIAFIVSPPYTCASSAATAPIRSPVTPEMIARTISRRTSRASLAGRSSKRHRRSFCDFWDSIRSRTPAARVLTDTVRRLMASTCHSILPTRSRKDATSRSVAVK